MYFYFTTDPDFIGCQFLQFQVCRHETRQKWESVGCESRKAKKVIPNHDSVFDIWPTALIDSLCESSLCVWLAVDNHFLKVHYQTICNRLEEPTASALVDAALHISLCARVSPLEQLGCCLTFSYISDIFGEERIFCSQFECLTWQLPEPKASICKFYISLYRSICCICQWKTKKSLNLKGESL